MRRKYLAVLAVIAIMAIATAVPGYGFSGDKAPTASPGAAPAAALRPEGGSIFMTVEGSRAGVIEGGAIGAGREGWIEVVGFSHEVVSPRDAASGLPTGKRQHKPISITKPIDKATPLLFQALVTNENLSNVELRFYKPDRTGREQLYYTIELTNASIAGIGQSQLVGDPMPLEEVSFTYEKIVWTWTDGGITAEDDWETPVS